MTLNPAAPEYHLSLPRTMTYTCFFPPPQHHIPFPCPLPFTPAHFSLFPVPPVPPTQPLSSSNPNLIWVPKEILRNKNQFLAVYPVYSPTCYQMKPTDLEFGTADPFLSRRTTIIIKNIPVKFTRAMLIQMLDQHCALHNKEIESAYDFVYVPIDFRTGFSRGFAFVNFTTSNAAYKAYEKFHHHKWIVFKTQKIAHVCYASIQGMKALVARFKTAEFRCHSDEFLPAIFTPPRNGMTSLPPHKVLGRRY